MSKKYYCAAYPCRQAVKLKDFMCDMHWNMVPAEIKKAVTDHYVKGMSEKDGSIPVEWREATFKAIDAVYVAETKCSLTEKKDE